jgi:hypothetical protein
MALAATDVWFRDIPVGLRAICVNGNPSFNEGKRSFYPHLQIHMLASICLKHIGNRASETEIRCPALGRGGSS